MTETLPHRQILTVSRLNREVQQMLDRHFALLWVEGEVSNLAHPRSGHLYFTLKDSGAQVRCAMFRNRNMYLDFAPRNGMQVIVRARVGVYEVRGDYQLNVEHMEEAGSGALQREFERLKKQLSAQGLFDEERKRPLPRIPSRVGLITSPSGAAVRDLLSVLGRRFPALPVVIYPVPVQGPGAAPAIVAALRTANRRRDCDVLIVSRGGGSLEDLWAFNEEEIARAIAESDTPVITGIGHEIDFTIADFVADRRAATPSAAAELVVPDREEVWPVLNGLAERLEIRVRQSFNALTQRLTWLSLRLRREHPSQRNRQHIQRLDEMEQRIALAARWIIAGRAQRLNAAEASLQAHSPGARLTAATQTLDALRTRLERASTVLLAQRRQTLAHLSASLWAYSPQGTLERGYGIVQRTRDDTVVRSHQDIVPGEPVTIRLSGDRLTGVVTGWEPLDPEADAPSASD